MSEKSGWVPVNFLSFCVSWKILIFEDQVFWIKCWWFSLSIFHTSFYFLVCKVSSEESTDTVPLLFPCVRGAPVFFCVFTILFDFWFLLFCYNVSWWSKLVCWICTETCESACIWLFTSVFWDYGSWFQLIFEKSMFYPTSSFLPFVFLSVSFHDLYT